MAEKIPVRSAFADTVFWVAWLNPKDQWHRRATEAWRGFERGRIYTTDEVLVEVLTHFSTAGPIWRKRAVRFIRSLLIQHEVVVVAQSRLSFLAGVQVYDSRPDKEFSMTDCISMSTMRALGLTEVLTHDYHFTQEGFVTLL
jgi:predicted nucleic acid-binding protein